MGFDFGWLMFGILVRCEVGCLCNFGDPIVSRFYCCGWG
jgi:hypothetical protein